MELVSKKVNVEEVTLTLNEKDFQVIGEWQSALASVTEETAYDLAKALAKHLEQLLLFLTRVIPDDIKSAKVVEEGKVRDKPVQYRKRSSKQTDKKNIKVTITNIDDNNVFQAVVRLFGRFVKHGDCMSIESQLKQDKGIVYLDNEQELNDLLDALLMYDLSDGKVPIKIQVER